jgi:hypothetical protein
MENCEEKYFEIDRNFSFIELSQFYNRELVTENLVFLK